MGDTNLQTRQQSMEKIMLSRTKRDRKGIILIRSQMKAFDIIKIIKRLE